MKKYLSLTYVYVRFAYTILFVVGADILCRMGLLDKDKQIERLIKMADKEEIEIKELENDLTRLKITFKK